ncbi:hypothetical protein B0H13DRAFT_1869048 [Mycena leptocephala]|nr:hypothetical protein B0H13DRAFT_1869048 [Mycena leptocephala]
MSPHLAISVSLLFPLGCFPPYSLFSLSSLLSLSLPALFKIHDTSSRLMSLGITIIGARGVTFANKAISIWRKKKKKSRSRAQPKPTDVFILDPPTVRVWDRLRGSNGRGSNLRKTGSSLSLMSSQFLIGLLQLANFTQGWTVQIFGGGVCTKHIEPQSSGRSSPPEGSTHASDLVTSN